MKKLLLTAAFAATLAVPAQANDALDKAIWGVATLMQYQIHCGNVTLKGQKIAGDVILVVGEDDIRLKRKMFEVLDDFEALGKTTWCAAIRKTLAAYVE